MINFGRLVIGEFFNQGNQMEKDWREEWRTGGGGMTAGIIEMDYRSVE